MGTLIDRADKPSVCHNSDMPTLGVKRGGVSLMTTWFHPTGYDSVIVS